jgi:3'-phosphoadenosine 5'-phosphosulfate synthase
VDLVVEPSLRESLLQEAGSMPRVKLSVIDLEWVHVVCEGWASPLRGFMRQHEYLQALHFNSLRIDASAPLVNMSVPIVLAIDDDQKEAIGSSASIALESPSDSHTVAVLCK